MVRSVCSICVRSAAVWACLAGFSAVSVQAGNAIRTLSLDESARVVELFDGMDSGQLEVRMFAKSAHESSVFVKNTTDEPLTVAVPKAVVGVHVLPQIFGQGNGFNNFGNNQNQNQGNNQQGRSQTVGGQMQPFGNNQQGFFNQNGNGNGNLPQGNGFFSIPPEKTVQLKLRTVCLDHGLPDPNPGLKYELRRVETEVRDPVLQQLLENYSPRVDQDAMQAAAWHLSNKLSWNQISNLADHELVALTGGRMFAPAAVKQAQSLVKQAEENANDRPAAPPVKQPEAPRKVAAKAKKVR